MIKCPKCDIIINKKKPMLCEECFHQEFQRITGKKLEWVFNQKTQEFEEVYKNLEFRQ
jgi:hypothetical protein